MSKNIQDNIDEIKKNDEDMIYDTRVSNSLFSQMMTADFCSVFFSMLGLFLSMCMYERKIIKGEDRNINFIDIYNCSCTVFLIISIVIKYDLQLKWSISVSIFT